MLCYSLEKKKENDFIKNFIKIPHFALFLQNQSFYMINTKKPGEIQRNMPMYHTINSYSSKYEKTFYLTPCTSTLIKNLRQH